MMAPGYQLPWIAQHDATAAIRADLQQVRQRMQRNREELSIVQREADDFCTFQRHVVQQAQQLGSHAAAPAVLPAFLSAATPEAAAMWQERHHAGQLYMLQQREQRAAAFLRQGQALCTRLAAEPAGGAAEGAQTSAAVPAVDASDSIDNEEVGSGEAGSEGSDDLERLILNLDAVDIEYEAD